MTHATTTPKKSKFEDVLGIIEALVSAVPYVGGLAMQIVEEVKAKEEMSPEDWAKDKEYSATVYDKWAAMDNPPSPPSA